MLRYAHACFESGNLFISSRADDRKRAVYAPTHGISVHARARIHRYDTEDWKLDAGPALDTQSDESS